MRERLDVIPALLRVLVIRRPNMLFAAVQGYRAGPCAGACGAWRPATETLIAQVIVSKFGDHLPFYRQAGIYSGREFDLIGPRWAAGRTCFHLQPIADQMRKHLAATDRLFMDETNAPVLDPGRGQTEKGSRLSA